MPKAICGNQKATIANSIMSMKITKGGAIQLSAKLKNTGRLSLSEKKRIAQRAFNEGYKKYLKSLKK